MTVRPYVEYSSNNSGGGWWLSDDDWRALEAAGWDVDWVAKSPSMARYTSTDGRYLGALAKSAKRYDMSMGDAIREWERVTGQDSSDLGCSCCGAPHEFTEHRADGTSRYWYPEAPAKGSRYEERQ